MCRGRERAHSHEHTHVCTTHLLQELSGIHQFTGAIRDSLHALLPLAIVLQILVFYIVTTSHHKHICLRGEGGREREGGRGREGGREGGRVVGGLEELH